MEITIMQIDANTINYLVNDGQIVLPYLNNEKHPWGKGWENSYGITRDDLKHGASDFIANNNHGAGLMPSGNWGYFDVDCDHDSANGKTPQEVFKPLLSLLGGGNLKRGSNWLHSTLMANKPGSQNYHFFFKTPNLNPVKFTGANAIFPSIEFANYGAPVRISAYHFLNLDMNKSFMENLSELPGYVSDAFNQIKLEKESPDPTSGQIKWWIKQPKADASTLSVDKRIALYLNKCKAPTSGGRHNTYRRILYTMVVKNGFDYKLVKNAIIQWDKANGVNQQQSDPDGFYSALTKP